MVPSPGLSHHQRTYYCRPLPKNRNTPLYIYMSLRYIYISKTHSLSYFIVSPRANNNNIHTMKLGGGGYPRPGEKMNPTCTRMHVRMRRQQQQCGIPQIRMVNIFLFFNGIYPGGKDILLISPPPLVIM